MQAMPLDLLDMNIDDSEFYDVNEAVNGTNSDNEDCSSLLDFHSEHPEINADLQQLITTMNEMQTDSELERELQPVRMHNDITQLGIRIQEVMQEREEAEAEAMRNLAQFRIRMQEITRQRQEAEAEEARNNEQQFQDTRPESRGKDNEQLNSLSDFSHYGSDYGDAHFSVSSRRTSSRYSQICGNPFDGDGYSSEESDDVEKLIEEPKNPFSDFSAFHDNEIPMQIAGNIIEAFDDMQVEDLVADMDDAPNLVDSRPVSLQGLNDPNIPHFPRQGCPCRQCFPVSEVPVAIIHEYSDRCYCSHCRHTRNPRYISVCEKEKRSNWLVQARQFLQESDTDTESDDDDA